MLLLTIATLVFALMLVEARRAAANERTQRLRGGIEARGDVYTLMRIAYPGAFAAMLVEGAINGMPGTTYVAAGAVIWSCAKGLKWWAIVTLGPFWTFRVIVVPQMSLIASGPYRWLRHPNYLGVVGELAGVALMTAAIATGPLATALFLALLARRIAVESRALATR